MTFRGLHSDAPGPLDDLTLLYRLVADEFEVLAGGSQRLYREVDFPVIELAQALDSWLRCGIADRRGFEFEPTGGEPGALQFRPTKAGWIIDSIQRAPDDAPPLITAEELQTSIQGFLHDVAGASAALGIDSDGLLERIRRSATVISGLTGDCQ